MEIATVLTNTYGPRLTNSANVKGAGEYARTEICGMAVWQTFDSKRSTSANGWTNERFTMKLASDPTTTFQRTQNPGPSELVTGHRRSRAKASVHRRPHGP
jgi:hypothetical protein